MFRKLLLTGLAVAAAVSGFAVESVFGSSERATKVAPYIGTWTARLTAEQARSAGDERLSGRFELTLRANGTYRTFNSLDGASTGVFKRVRDKLVFSKDKACIEGGFRGEGKFRWWLKAGRLKFETVFEPCGGRAQTLTYPTWRRK